MKKEIDEYEFNIEKRKKWRDIGTKIPSVLWNDIQEGERYYIPPLFGVSGIPRHSFVVKSKTSSWLMVDLDDEPNLTEFIYNDEIKAKFIFKKN